MGTFTTVYLYLWQWFDISLMDFCFQKVKNIGGVVTDMDPQYVLFLYFYYNLREFHHSSS